MAAPRKIQLGHAEIYDLHRQGYTNNEIGRMAGVTGGRISHILRDYRKVAPDKPTVEQCYVNSKGQLVLKIAGVEGGLAKRSECS